MANLKYKDGETWNSISVIRGPKGDNADITVNGQTKENANFYAPETGGTPGQTLISYGDGQAPQWANLASVATSGNYNDLHSLPTIPTTTNDVVSGSSAALTSGGAYTALGQRGIPAGGSAGEVLIKDSSTNYDVSWGNLSVLNKVYPVGSKYISNSSTNPSSILGGGTWVQERTLYGGELIGYAVAKVSGSGSTEAAAGERVAFSDNKTGTTTTYDVTNYVDGVLYGGSGAIRCNTKGIVGMVKATMCISGYGGSGCRGFWYPGTTWNELPSGVTCLSNNVLLTGPIDSNYGGTTSFYTYKVTTTSDVEFWINPVWSPYAGSFRAGSGGVGSVLFVEAYAKHGTSYLWRRTG